MRVKRPWLTMILAAAFPVTGCATTHMAGEYRPSSMGDVVHRHDQRTIAKGSEWLFFWGLLDTGHFDLNNELRHNVRDNEAITDLDVKDRLSVGGALLWLITGGIVSHHSIVVKGSPAEIRRESSAPPAGYSTQPQQPQRETIIVNPPKEGNGGTTTNENR